MKFTKETLSRLAKAEQANDAEEADASEAGIVIVDHAGLYPRNADGTPRRMVYPDDFSDPHDTPPALAAWLRSLEEAECERAETALEAGSTRVDSEQATRPGPGRAFVRRDSRLHRDLDRNRPTGLALKPAGHA